MGCYWWKLYYSTWDGQSKGGMSFTKICLADSLRYDKCHVCKKKNSCVYICVYAYMYISVFIYAYMCMYIYVCVRKNMCIYTHIKDLFKKSFLLTFLDAQFFRLCTF